MVDNSDVERPSEMCLILTILLSIFNSIDFIGLISHHYESSVESVAPQVPRRVQVREVLSNASVAFQRPPPFCLGD